MRLRSYPLRLVLAVSLAACSDDASTEGGDEASTATGGSGDCASVANVSDGPTTDEDVDASAPVLLCYYPQPSEGYCRTITNAAEIAAYADAKDKGAIGCADAVILAGPECPTANAVGRCDDNTIDASRVYYTCSKFADPEAHCAMIGGTYAPP